MNDAQANWTEQGQPGGYYDEQQQQQYQQQQQNVYEQTPGGDYMMQDNNMNAYHHNGQDIFEDDDDEDDILDEMEDGAHNNDMENNGHNYENDPDGNMHAHAQKDQGDLLLMKFCPHDSSMLYPKEDKRTKTLRYACGLRHCRYSEETHTSMVYQNIMKQEVKNVLHKVPSAVSDDPSLPRTQNESCESCGYNEAVFFQSDTSDVRNDTLALIFVCCSCGHKWVK